MSVHAVIRIKPQGSGLSGHRGSKNVIQEFSTTSLTVRAAPQLRTYSFDHIFGPETSQPEIYRHFETSTDYFLEGFNVTILAYGQSGSGKSYTMGTADSAANHELISEADGIVQRSSAALFQALAFKYSNYAGAGAGSGLSSGGFSGSRIRPPSLISQSTSASASEPRPYSLKVSYLELYNEQFRDLLDSQTKPQPVIREDSAGNTSVSGLRQVEVSNHRELLKLLQNGSELRQKGSTALNSESSRSHAIFTIYLTQDGATSKFHFVDLAGSERLKNSEARGERVKEGIAINGGLASLGKVISQLSIGGRGHVSFRDSKLTRLLQDSLGGKAITYLLSCITCDDAYVSETVSTLSYAQRARSIQLTPEIQQADVFGADDIEQLKKDLLYWKGRALDAEAQSGGQTPSHGSMALAPSPFGTPSRSQSRNSVRVSPSRASNRSPIRSPTKSSRSASVVDDFEFHPNEVSSPPSTVGANPPSAGTLSNGQERLSHSTEMQKAIDDMIKQYDLSRVSLETSLLEERKEHDAARDTIIHLEVVISQREAEIDRLLLEKVKSESTVPRQDVAILESQLDASKIDHRRTLDELKRLSSHYEVLRKDLDRSRKEVEKEKQLKHELVQQMKKSNTVSDDRPRGAAGSLPNSLFASLPRIGSDDSEPSGSAGSAGSTSGSSQRSAAVTSAGTRDKPFFG